ncbi:MAG: helix-turn-helix domain-containing protein [Bacteroidales bacterium]|nr:helix-turn-helix domain-containing protein [Bacteroidales bacterium]
MEIVKDRLFALAEKYVNETGVSVFLTGKAGTGKTTFLRYIVEHTCKRAVVLAPTGVAAVNAQGSTIHSFFGLPLCPYLPDVPELQTEYQMPERYRRIKRDKERIIKTLDLLIIDEISMVRADLLDAVDMSLRRLRHSDKPFGGVQLLMIGDAQQLSPVVTEQERPYIQRVYPSPYFFHSKALLRLHYVTIELQAIYRQEDQAFINLLNAVREQRLSREMLQKLNSRVGAPAGEDWIRLTTHNVQADSINQEKMAALPSKEHIFEASIQGDYPESLYPAATQLHLKVGARVMFLRNDPEGQFYNGKIATVSEIHPEAVQVTDDKGKELTVSRMSWENMQYSLNEENGEIEQKTIGSFSQFPLRPAWAITIHKSQGLTFEHVIIDAGAAFAFGQVYVALSRCRSLEGISLSRPITPSVLFQEADVTAFHAGFPSVNSVAEALPSWQQRYAQDLRADCFTFEALRQQLCTLRKLWREHLGKAHPELLETLEKASSQVIEAESVALRFRKQMAALSTQASALKERMEKAAAYFLPILEGLPVRTWLSAEIGNAELRKRVQRLGAELLPQWQMHLLTLREVLANGFDSGKYLKLRTQALLGEAGPRKQARKLKEPKPEKVPTTQQTLALYREGLDLSAIARRRELSQETIFRHLLSFVESGEVDIHDLVPEEHLLAVVDYFTQHPEVTMLSPCYEALGGAVPYEEIRAVRYWMKPGERA